MNVRYITVRAPMRSEIQPPSARNAAAGNAKAVVNSPALARDRPYIPM